MSRDGMQILSVYSKEGSRYIECYDVVMEEHSLVKLLGSYFIRNCTLFGLICKQREDDQNV